MRRKRKEGSIRRFAIVRDSHRNVKLNGNVGSCFRIPAEPPQLTFSNSTKITPEMSRFGVGTSATQESCNEGNPIRLVEIVV